MRCAPFSSRLTARMLIHLPSLYALCSLAALFYLIFELRVVWSRSLWSSCYVAEFWRSAELRRSRVKLVSCDSFQTRPTHYPAWPYVSFDIFTHALMISDSIGLKINQMNVMFRSFKYLEKRCVNLIVHVSLSYITEREREMRLYIVHEENEACFQ